MPLSCPSWRGQRIVGAAGSGRSHRISAHANRQLKPVCREARLRLPQVAVSKPLVSLGARRSRASAILPWSRHKRGDVAGDTRFERAGPPRALQWRRSLRLARDDALRCKFGDAGGVIAQLFEKRRGVGAGAAGRGSGARSLAVKLERRGLHRDFAAEVGGG
jgi:hypothetical protein